MTNKNLLFNKKALITGVTGQDGAYLAVFLLEEGGWKSSIAPEEGIKQVYFKKFQKQNA